MPIFVNPLAGSILLPVDLLVFLLRETSAVRLPIVVDLLMDVLFAMFQIGALAWR
jgi:hypothetical protein